MTKRTKPRSLASPQARRRVLRAIKRGHNREDAAALAGCAYNTLLSEMKADPDFAALVEKAKLCCKARMVSMVHKGALTDPKLALAWLERHYPNEWSRNANVTHEGSIEHTHRLSVDEQRTELADLIASLRERAGANGHPPAAASNGNGKHGGNGQHN